MKMKQVMGLAAAVLMLAGPGLVWGQQNAAPSKEAPKNTEPRKAGVSPTAADPSVMPKSGEKDTPLTKPGAPEPPTATNAEIKFEEMNHDFGRIASGKPQTHKFKFTNTGTEKLVVQQVRTSCGCTAAALDKKEFEPGEGSTIDVTFNPKGKGVQAKTITVVHNGRNGPDTMLNIKSEVFEPVEVIPPTLQLGDMVRGKARTEHVMVVSEDSNLQIKSIDVNGDLVEAKVASAPPSDVQDARAGKVGIDITFDGNLPVGRFLRVITVKAMASPTAGAPQEEWELKINAFANVVGDLKAEPASIRVPTTNPNTAFSEEVIVSRRSGQPFKIIEATPVNANLPGLEVKTEPYASGDVKGYKVIFSGNTGPTAGIIRGNVLLKTDVAEEPEFRVQFTGMIRDPNVPKGEAPPPSAPMQLPSKQAPATKPTESKPH
ncbi:MAG TPA: DUF1573 domain-containing protein [Phycisphaerales bacterium]|nr:DUF1573 domain-containing protein [Phycisphaerales bacterium]